MPRIGKKRFLDLGVKHRSLLDSTAGASLLVAAAVLAALVHSAWNHAEILAYDLGVDTALVPPMRFAISIAAAVSAAAALLLWCKGSPRKWMVWLALQAGALLTILSGVLIHTAEMKYQRGDMNLVRVGIHARNPTAWQARADALRAGILRGAGLSPLPPRTPLNTVTHGRREENGYSVENVYFESLPGFYVAGNLYKPSPSDPAAKYPVILLPQGHFSEGRFDASIQHLGASFARMGALAFSYDMVGRGENHQVKHNHANALTLQLWNSMRTLDFLLSLPETDASRVGMTGASGGGSQTFFCTAVDPRVTVAAPVAIVSSKYYGGCKCELGLHIHWGAGYETNNAEITALAAPRPLLVVSDGADWTLTVPRLEYPYLRRVYALYGREADVENAHFIGEDHDYGPSKRQAVYRFFAKHLGLNSGGIDENVNTIAPRQALEAFDALHPIPADALRGWDAVMQQLNSLQKGS